ncbi:hypothetical protein GW7_06464 [Heterocephalus glaber]|uniref:Uncharacterized protein n=1 Tax=Heterocephalus glaber TaxID=10181 RepID=G5C986_HETGA|nr:hypothetical protein GW7_06464 [Heterocephalus glaber]
MPQAAVSVRPLALHLVPKARGSRNPSAGQLQTLTPPLRGLPAQDTQEEKPQPLPPKENPWTKKPSQHLPPLLAATELSPTPPDTLEAELSAPKPIKAGILGTNPTRLAISAIWLFGQYQVN